MKHLRTGDIVRIVVPCFCRLAAQIRRSSNSAPITTDRPASRQEPQFRTLLPGRFAVRLFQLQPLLTFHLPWESSLDFSVPGRRTRTGGRRVQDTASASRNPPPKKNIPLQATPHHQFTCRKPSQSQALNRFQRAAIFHPSPSWPKSSECRSPHIGSVESIIYAFCSTPALYTVDREGIRCGRYPNLASFRTPRGAAASARSGKSAYFGFVPPDGLPRLLRHSKACRQPYPI